MCEDDSKDALRQVILSRRTELSTEQWAVEDAARTKLLLAALGEVPATLALYASRPHEPATHAAITRLHGAGWRILLPMTGSPHKWALFDGWEHMRPGWGGIPEPVPPFRRTPELSEADVVVTACLAVAADGTRLGTGGGWYDKALPRRRPGVPVWALARSTEMVEFLPSEPHDVPVDRVVTELGSHTCGEATMPGISAPWQSELS